MTSLGLEHLGDNWLVDAHGVLWNRAHATVREHRWHENGCSDCGGCIYAGCDVHELCDCAGKKAA